MDDHLPFGEQHNGNGRIGICLHRRHIGYDVIDYSAVVMLLRQTVGLKLQPFDALFAHAYVAFGLTISMGATVWQISSDLVGFLFFCLVSHILPRRQAASGERTSLYPD